MNGIKCSNICNTKAATTQYLNSKVRVVLQYKWLKWDFWLVFHFLFFTFSALVCYIVRCNQTTC